MAPFNPEVSVKPDPSYLGLSKPISDIPNSLVAKKGDNTLSELFKGFGDVLTLATKGVDTVIKNDIDNRLFAQTNQERDQYTEALGTVISPGVTGATSEETVAQQTPSGVQDGLDNVAKLQSAKAAKQFPETYYYQRLNTVVKDMRSQYPGYRQYIDSQVSAITGTNPANAYLASLQKQFQASQSGRDDDKIRALGVLQPLSGNQGVPEMIAKVLNGEASYFDAMKFAQPINALKVQRAENEARVKDAKLVPEVRAMAANDAIDSETPLMVANIVSGIQSKAGGQATAPDGTVVQTAGIEQVGAALINASKNPGSISADTAVALGVQYNALITSEKQKVMADWIKRGFVKALGGQEIANKKLEASFAPLDQIIQMVKDNQLGPAYVAANLSKAAVDQTTQNLYNDKDWGQTLRHIKSFGDMQGPGRAMIDKLITDQMVLKDARTGKSFQDGVQGMMLNARSSMLLQPGTKNGGNVVYSMNDAISTALAKGVKAPEIMDLYLKTADQLNDKKVPDEVKYNLAKAISDEKNIGMLSKFTMDGKDSSGNYIQGRYVAFGKLVNENVAKEVKRLSESTGDAKLWDDYSSFVRHSFTNELFGSDVKSLRNFDSKSVKLAWDSDNNKIIATKEKLPGDFYRSSEAERLSQDKAVATVNRINQGLDSIKGYAKATGPNASVAAIALRTLLDAGVDPRNWEGIPKNIFNILMNQNMKEQGVGK